MESVSKLYFTNTLVEHQNIFGQLHNETEEKTDTSGKLEQNSQSQNHQHTQYM